MRHVHAPCTRLATCHVAQLLTVEFDPLLGRRARACAFGLMENEVRLAMSVRHMHICATLGTTVVGQQRRQLGVAASAGSAAPFGGVRFESPAPALVMELAEGGTLKSFILRAQQGALHHEPRLGKQGAGMGQAGAFLPPSALPQRALAMVSSLSTTEGIIGCEDLLESQARSSPVEFSLPVRARLAYELAVAVCVSRRPSSDPRLAAPCDPCCVAALNTKRMRNA